MFDKFNAVVPFFPKFHVTIGACRYDKDRAWKKSLEKKDKYKIYAPNISMDEFVSGYKPCHN